MLSHYILDDRGNPVEVPLEEWAVWFGKPDRLLARGINDRGGYVSFVFLGLADEMFEILYREESDPDGGDDIYRFSTFEEGMLKAQELMARK